jgi:murein DD-endopeptidase MepM/ murein hydrolase activator NlpD
MEEKKKNKFFQRILKERFRITFFHDDFKPVFSLRFTLFTLVLWLVGYATVIILVTTFIIAKTSLKEYIPGYGSFEEKKQIVQLFLKTDSLENVIHQKDIYLQGILKAIKGEKDSVKPLKKTDTKDISYDKLKASASEKKIRQEIETEMRNSVYSSAFVGVSDIPAFQYLPPCRGVVINKFSRENGHYGIDIVGKMDDPVRCIYKGVVIDASYSVKYGNTIIVLHPDGWISVYKHLSLMMKNIGNYVNTNDIIGTMGNTGTESTGVHLHFELWYQDKAVDPMMYIAF